MKLTYLLLSVALVLGLGCAPRTMVAPPAEAVSLYPAPQPVYSQPCPMAYPQPMPAPYYMASGYQVQIYAFLSPDRAERAACYARQQGLPAAVDFLCPYYKVRVGGGLNRWQAERLRQRAVALGYYDAFVVSAPCR